MGDKEPNNSGEQDVVFETNKERPKLDTGKSQKPQDMAR